MPRKPAKKEPAGKDSASKPASGRASAKKAPASRPAAQQAEARGQQQATPGSGKPRRPSAAAARAGKTQAIATGPTAAAKPKPEPKAKPRPGAGRSTGSHELSDELQDLLRQETRMSQGVPLREGASVSYRDEANVIVHEVLRNGFLEELHSGEWSPALADPSVSRITQDEMKRLMIETSAELAHWLYARDMDLVENPEHYLDKIHMLRNIYTQDWEGHEVTWTPPEAQAQARRARASCNSCQAPLSETWRFCPRCGERTPG